MKKAEDNIDDEAALKGTAQGFGGDVNVAVSMDGDKITKVVVQADGETPGVGTPAIEQLPAKIVEANSPDVDVIAGSTVTSKAIIEAVKNALENNGEAEEPAEEVSSDINDAPIGDGSVLIGSAKGFNGTIEVTLTMDGDKIANVEIKGDGETPGFGTRAMELLPEKIIEANSADVEIVAGATITSDAIIEAVKDAFENKGVQDNSSALKGTAKGFNGDIIVYLTMDGDKIEKVEIQGDGETPGFGTRAIEQLPEKIVEANSADVEIIAGATVTSEAIIEAVKDALGQ